MAASQSKLKQTCAHTSTTLLHNEKNIGNKKHNQRHFPIHGGEASWVNCAFYASFTLQFSFLSSVTFGTNHPKKGNFCGAGN